MNKFLSGLLISFLLIFNLPISNAAKPTNTIDLKSQTKLWLTDRANITFTIAETSGNQISNAEVAISTDALLGRSAIRQVIKKPNTVDYRSIFETATIEQNENEYSFTMPGSKWQFNGAGTYALRITVYVRGEAQKVTSFISFLPKSVTINKLRVSTVLPLIVNSGLTPNDSILNDDTANLFLDGAGINSVLSVGRKIKNVTWVLDSDTLRLAQSIATSNVIASPEIHNATEDQISGAENWLAKVITTVNSQNAFVAPTGNVDSVALNNENYKRIAALSLSDTQYVTDYFAGLEFKKITIAPDGDYPNSGFEWLKSNQIKTNLLNSEAYPAQDSTYTPNGVVRDGVGNKSPVIDRYASGLFSDAIGSDINSGMYQAAFAGDLLITALEQPGVKRFLVIKPDINQTDITDAKFKFASTALKAPWLAQVKLSKFQDFNVGNRNRNATENKLNQSTKDLIKSARTTKSNLASLISGAIEEKQLDFAILRAANEVADTSTKESLNVETTKFLDQLNDAVRIMSAGSVIFPNENAKVPITVRNDLSVPIEIHIETVGLPSVRVIPDSVEDLEIAPGRRKSIEIPTRLIGTDTAYLQLQITDSNGKHIGQPILIQLSSSAYAQAAAWVIGAAFALLLVFAIRNTLKRIRASRGNSRENTEL